VSPRASRPLSKASHDAPEQLPLPAATKAPAKRRDVDPEQAARVAIARRAKLSAVPGFVKLVLTLELPRAVAERLSAKGIRDGKNLEAIITEILKAGAP
jgi:hypothetical protein